MFKFFSSVVMCFSFTCLIFMNRPHAQDMATGATVTIGREAMLPDNPRTHYGRCVNDAPVEGETLRLNPPRFRWSYHPDGNRGGLFMFVFQIADSPKFDDMIVNVTTPFNFYNTIAPFSGRGPYYWRVGYIEGESADGKKPFRWSPVCSFRIAAGAIDKSLFAEILSRIGRLLCYSVLTTTFHYDSMGTCLSNGIFHCL